MLVLVSASVGVSLLRNMATPTEVVEPDRLVAAGLETDTAQIYVHVAGEVKSPGLYRLDFDARVIDAIAAAGGTLPEADLQAVNLARSINDGEQLIVPAFGEVAAGTSGAASDGKVNINTADSTTLQTLPRVGPALAERIIEWRESNGPFRGVDDLLAVSGIGEKMLAGLREKVTV